MKHSRTKITVWLLAVAVIAVAVLGAWIPKWFLNRQIRCFLSETHIADDVFQIYQFASEEGADTHWIKQDLDSQTFQDHAAMTVNALSELTENGVLPSFGENKYYCLAVYAGEGASGDETGLWKAFLYIPGTKCTVDYCWDSEGIRKIFLKCDAGNDVSYLPEPIMAASSLFQNGSVFSLCSDTGFVQENETKQIFCIRSRLTQGTLH